VPLQRIDWPNFFCVWDCGTECASTVKCEGERETEKNDGEKEDREREEKGAQDMATS